jgi:hypothetical protein
LDPDPVTQNDPQKKKEVKKIERFELLHCRAIFDKKTEFLGKNLRLETDPDSMKISHQRHEISARFPRGQKFCRSN